MTDTEKQAQADSIRKALDLLMEHFEAVQILATAHDSESGTLVCKRGEGNFYARLAMAREFISEDEARCQEIIRKEEAE